MEPKAGIWTSEFWVAFVVVLAGAAAAVWAEHPLAKAAGIVAAALSSAGYGFTRMGVKKAASGLVLLAGLGAMAGCSCPMDKLQPPITRGLAVSTVHADELVVGQAASQDQVDEARDIQAMFAELKRLVEGEE